MIDLKMEVYTPELELIGFLEIQRSVIWEEKAFSAGSFSVESLITPESLVMLQPENIVWIEGDTAGIIECVQEQSGQNGPYITVKGRTLTGILDRRILWGLYNLTGTPPEIMHYLVNECCINPTRGDVEARKIPGLVLENPLSPVSKLPDGYTELEYIQSNGTQYIDTGFNPTSDTNVFAIIKVPDWQKRVCLFGARETASDTAENQFVVFYTNTNYLRYDYFNGQKISVSTDLSDKVDLIIEGNVFQTGENFANANKPSELKNVSKNLIIFAMNNAGDIGYKSSFSLYSFKIYKENEAIIDYIPCINQSGSVGLYDTVSKTFFGNSGSGVFTAGPTISTKTRLVDNSGEEIHIQKTGGYLLDVLGTLGETYGVAFGVRFNPAVPQMEFWTRWGQNRTIHQNDNDPVFYSTELDDVLSSEYLYNSREYRNVSLVAGEGEGKDRVYVTVEGDTETPVTPPPTPPEPPTPTKYTITLTVDPAGGGTASGGKTVAAGVSVTVTATPSDGYTFTGWSENGDIVSTNASYTFTVTSDRTLTAIFAVEIPVYTITATIDPAGSGTVTGAGQYQEGETCILVATVSDGYKFTGWQEGGQTISTEAEYTFQVTNNRELTAVFEEEPVIVLPSGYTLLKYIESPSTLSGIDTGVKIDESKTKIEVEIEANLNSRKMEQSIIASLGSDFPLYVKRNSEDTEVICVTYKSTVSINTSILGRKLIIVLDFFSSVFSVGNDSISIQSSSLKKRNPQFIFRGTSSGRGIEGKIYSAKIYDGNDLQRNFVPCTNPSGVAGLYDLVEGKFYQSAFSDYADAQFTAGPAV